MANADPKLSHIVAEPIGTSLEEEIFSKPGVVSLAWKESKSEQSVVASRV